MYLQIFGNYCKSGWVQSTMQSAYLHRRLLPLYCNQHNGWEGEKRRSTSNQDRWFPCGHLWTPQCAMLCVPIIHVATLRPIFFFRNLVWILGLSWKGHILSHKRMLLEILNGSKEDKKQILSFTAQQKVKAKEKISLTKKQEVLTIFFVSQMTE